MKVNKWMLLLFMTVFLTTSVHNRASASDSVPKVDTSGWVDVKKPAHLPILMYHSISRGTDSLHVPKEQFREQMKWLSDHGYYTLSPAEAFAVLTQNKKPRAKSVLITLDDGYEDNYTSAYPVLREYGMKATIFMIVNAIGTNNYLKKQQLLEMDQHGIAVESHTMTHPDLTKLTPLEQKEEMAQSKDFFEKLFHKKMTILCYPYGRYNSETVRLAQQTGYKMAVTIKPGTASENQGMFTLHRIRVSPDMSIKGFGRIVDRAQH